MSKKQDPYLKILHQLSDISNLRTPQPHKYNLVYFPKRIQGPYKGCSFQLTLILPNGFPQNPPQIFFSDIPYHLNIDSKDGRLNATFLSQDWCSFMTFDLIFSEINALLENPDEKSPACQKTKNIYFSNKNLYLNQIDAWKSANGFLSNKNAVPKTSKQINIKNAKQSKVQQVISFPQTIYEFQDNSVKEINKNSKSKPNSIQSISHELQLQLFSPRLKRKGSSPLVIQSSRKRKNAQSNSAHNISNKLQSSHFSPQISNQNLNFILVEEQANQNKDKKLKSSKKIINSVNSPIMKLKSNADSSVGQGQKIFQKAKSKEGNQISFVSEVHTEKQKKREQRKQTMEIRNLFKQKQSRNRQEKNIGQFSISSIQQKQEEQNNCNLQKHQISIKNQAISPFQINIRENHGQFRSLKNTDQQKTTRRMELSPNGNRTPSIHQQKQILSSSIKTIKLTQKLEICELDSHSIKSNMQKLTTLTRALMNQCNCLQKMMQSSQNEIFKQLLQQKLHQQAQFIEKLQNMYVVLKNSIVQFLTTEVEEMLQK